MQFSNNPRPVRYPARFSKFGMVAPRSSSCRLNPPFANPYCPLACGINPVSIADRDGLHDAYAT